MGLTALDIVVVVLVGAGLVFGIMRGFVAELLSLFAWILAIMALSYLHAPVRDLLTGPVGTESGAATAAGSSDLAPEAARATAPSSGLLVSSSGSSAWACHDVPQEAHRTVRPSGPSLESSTKYRVAHSGQVSIMPADRRLSPSLRGLRFESHAEKSRRP